MRNVLFRLAGISICISFLLLQQTSVSGAANKKDGVINTPNKTVAAETDIEFDESKYKVAINIDYRLCLL